MKLISIFLVLLFSCTSNDHNVSDDSAIESVLLSLIDDLSKPFASYGFEGHTTFNPGQFAYQDSKA